MQQQRRPRVLLDLAVQPRGQLEVGGVHVGLDPRPEGAESVELLGPRPLAVLCLQVTSGDVVRAGIAEDDLGDAASWNLPAEPTDHHRELTLKVDPGTEFSWPLNGVVRPADRRRWLEEDDRLGRRLTAHFPCMIGVILADADHLARQDRRMPPDLSQRNPETGQPDRLVPAAERMPGKLSKHELTAVAPGQAPRC